MGWSSGPRLAESLYAKVRAFIPCEHRARIAADFIDAFEEHDADDWDEGAQLWRDSARGADSDG